MSKVEMCDVANEVVTVLNYTDSKLLENLPKEILKYLQITAEQSDKSFTIEPEKKLNEQNLSEESKNLIALLFGLYMANEKDREYIKNCWDENEANYQSELREKYSVDKLFNKNIKENVQTTALVEYKEPVYKKVLNGILAFFHLKNK